MLKCSRCRHVFPAPTAKKQAAEPAAAAKKPTPAVDESLTLPFDEPAWKDDASPAPSDDLTVPESDEQYTLGTDEPADELVLPEGNAAAEPDTTPLQYQLEKPSREAAPRETAPRATQSRTSAPRQPLPRAPATSEDDDEVEVNITDDAVTRDAGERGKVWALLIFLATVLASYGMLTRALFASPQLCDRLLSRMPLIGALGDERLLTRKIALSDITGTYQRIKDGKEVFVINGKALNTAPVALHGVQIVGKLFNSEGHELDQKVIYCGNVISTKMLKDLTPPQVSILQTLSPPKRFTIEPGESSIFVIVFMNPPREAVEFSTQVAAAQRQA